MRYLYGLISALAALAVCGHFAADWWITLVILVAIAWATFKKPGAA